jgi:hypothetical protein
MTKEVKNQVENAENAISLEEAKTNVAEANAAVRKFKRANKIRPNAEIEDEAIADEFQALLDAAEEARAVLDTLQPAEGKKPRSGGAVGGSKYTYPDKAVNPLTGEEFIVDKAVQKRWRVTARKQAKKLDCLPEEVPFDVNMLYKPKAEPKPKKEKEKNATDTPAPEKADKKADKVKKGKAKPSKEEEED